MEKISAFFQSTILASTAIVIMNVIGSYVSAIGAGMACPDWPLCPFPDSFPVLMEFLHRVWGVFVVLTILLTVIRARRLEPLRGLKVVKALAQLSLLVVMIQVAMGAIVVFTALRPEFVALHQLLAQITLAFQAVAAGLSWAEIAREAGAEKSS
ncbi:MAG: COX15/CtaA family protein [Nitrososphaerota archaeon]